MVQIFKPSAVIFFWIGFITFCNSQNKSFQKEFEQLKSKVRVGGTAPDFQLLDQNDKLISMRDFKGKVVYLYFWSTTCKPCLPAYGKIQNLKTEFGDDVEFIMINVDKNKAQWKEFLEKRKWGGYQLWAPDKIAPINYYLLSMFKDGSWGYPLPGSAIIDEEQIITYNPAPVLHATPILKKALYNSIN